MTLEEKHLKRYDGEMPDLLKRVLGEQYLPLSTIEWLLQREEITKQFGDISTISSDVVMCGGTRNKGKLRFFFNGR